MTNIIKSFTIALLFPFICLAQTDSALTVQLLSQNSNQQGNISLDSLLNIKISSASKHFETLSQAPSSVSIITADDIERYGYRNFTELFNAVRGFYVSYDRNYAYLGVRGFSRPTDYNDRIHMTINGHSVNDYYYGQAPVGTDLVLPISSIERVEIIRGPGSVVYGNNAMFAIINFVTKAGTSYDRTNVTVQAGSEGKKEVTCNYGDEISEDLSVFLSGMISDTKGRDIYYHEYDSPATNNGIAKNLDWDRSRGFISLITYKNLSFQAHYGYREKGVPTASYSTIFNDSRAKTIDQMSFGELKFLQEISPDKSLTFRAYFDHYAYKGHYPYSLPSEDYNNNNWLGTEVLYQWDITTSNRLISAAEFKSILCDKYESSTGGIRQIFNDKTFNTISVFVQDEFQVNSDLSCNVGIRFDKQSNTEGMLAPRFAAIYSPTRQTTVKLIYGQSFRYPNSYELYYADSISRFKQSNDLLNEKIITNEFILERKFSTNFFGSLSLYHNRVNDLIDQVSNSADTSLQFKNIRGLVTTGGEIECSARLVIGLAGYVRYSYQYSYDQETNTKLTNSPSHLVKCGLSVPFLHDYSASVEGSYESSRLTLSGAKTDPFVLLNVDLLAKYFSNKLKVSLKITNALNKTYFYPGGFEHLQDVIAQDPRTYNLKMSYDF